MTPRIASAPVSFGVFELTAGRDDLPAGSVLAATMADLGYAGSELGPPGYFGDGAAVGRGLERARHQLVQSLVGDLRQIRVLVERALQERRTVERVRR